MNAELAAAVREVVDAAAEKVKWDALAPSVAAMEDRAGTLFRSQARDVKAAVAAQRKAWPKATESLTPAREASVPDRIGEFFERVLTRRRGRDAERLRPPMGTAAAAALKTIGKAKWGISFTLEDVGATAYMKERGAWLVRELNATTVADLRAILTRGISEGWSYDRVAKEIIAKYASYAAPRGQRGITTRAHLIAVTESAYAYEHSHMAQARMLEAAGLPMLKEWGVSGDERTCPVCEGNGGDGAIKLGELFSSGDEMPPAHPACVVGSTRVLATAVSAATKRLYDGPLVVLTTALGYELACTPNHPVMTPRGWIAAGALHEGDDVISCSRDEWMPAGIDEHHDDAPALVHEVAQAFRQALPVTTSEVETAPEDFHGDGAGSEVAVVWTDGLLPDTCNATIREHLGKPALIRSHVRRVALTAERSLAARFEAAAATAVRFVRGLRVPLVLLGAAGGHHLAVRFEDASPRNLGVQEPLRDRPAVDTVRTGQCVFGLAGKVPGADFVVRKRNSATAAGGVAPSAEVLAHRGGGDPVPPRDIGTGDARNVVVDKLLYKLVRERWTGHVFNLQTASETYFAAGILTHNCRCWSTTYLDPAAEPPADVTVAGQSVSITP